MKIKPVAVVDSLSPIREIKFAKCESEADHLERVRKLFEQRKAEMGQKYSCAPLFFVKRLDGRDAHYKPSERARVNVRQLKRVTA